MDEIYDLIGIQPGMVQKLRRARKTVDFTALGAYFDGLMDPETAGSAYAELSEKLGGDPDGAKMLLCQLECARRDRERYAALGISEDIYVATMRCFSRFIHETERRTGRLAFDRGWWTWRQVAMTLFRVGELEFELREYNGEMVLSIHIPSDADLSPDAVSNSLSRAKELMNGRFGGGRRVMCSSWLLSPALVPLLSEGSNILAFRGRFDIVEWDADRTEFIQWLFDASEDTPFRELPGRTSLQRGVRELLLNGGKVGSARGWLTEQEV